MYDAIIIGAGPAGGMAARAPSNKGYKVLVIDKRKEVGRPIQCAGGLSHSALENNNLEPQDSWIKAKIRGAKIIVPNGKYFYATTKLGYTINRTRFDQWIINKAIDDGAELLLNTRVKRVKRKNDVWHVETKNGYFLGKILIGADGPSSNIAQWIGLLKRKEYMLGLQYKFRARDIDYSDTEHFCTYASAKYNGGYAWVFPMGDEYNVGVGSYGNIKLLLKEFCKSLSFDVDKKTEINAGIIPYHYVLDDFSRNGALIVGDAAGTTNPMSGGGIHAAMISGRLAGEAAGKALDEDDLSIISEYSDRLKKEPFLDPILFKASQIFRKWDDELYNFLGDMMEGIEQSQLTYLQGLKNMIGKPKYLLFWRQFLIMKKAMQINQKYGW